MEESRQQDHAIWEALSVYDDRNQKVAVTLAAVARLFDEQKPLHGGEQEFMSIYDALHSLTPPTFTRLIQSPETYCWVHHAYALIRAFFESKNSEATEPLAPIVEHLEQFKRLALGAFITEEKSIRFKRPFQSNLPLNLPCTDLLLHGECPVDIRGFSDGCIDISTAEYSFRLPTATPANEPSGDITLLKQPSIALDSHKVILSPYVFSSSKIESPDRCNTLDLGYRGHQESLPLVEESFRVMRRFAPDAYEQIAAVTTHIGLNDPERSDRSQTSLSDMPGTFIVPCYVNPHANVECIIHEFFHNRLFALEEIGRIFVSESDEKGQGSLRLFSPWRVSCRPIKGLLHSTFVFIPVARFWLALYEGTAESDPAHALAREDSIRQLLNLKVGMHLLQIHGRYTPHGQTIVNAMQARVDELTARSIEIGLEEDATAMEVNLDGSITPLRWIGYDEPVNVRENLRVNIRNHDINGDCRDLPFRI